MDQGKEAKQERRITISTEQKVIKDGELPTNEVFTATLELRSVGNSRNIIPEVRWSHALDGDLEARAEADKVPYSYISMFQILSMIKAIIKPVDGMLQEQLPEDSDEAARIIDAMAEKEESDGKVN